MSNHNTRKETPSGQHVDPSDPFHSLDEPALYDHAFITSSPTTAVPVKPPPKFPVKSIMNIRLINIEDGHLVDQDVLQLPLIENPGFRFAYNQLQRYRPGLAGYMYPYLFRSMDVNEMPEEYWDILYNYRNPNTISDNAPVLTDEEILALIYLYDFDRNTSQAISDLYEIGYTTEMLPQHLRNAMEYVISSLGSIYGYDTEQPDNLHNLNIKSFSSLEPETSYAVSQPDTGLPIEEPHIPLNIFPEPGLHLTENEALALEYITMESKARETATKGRELTTAELIRKYLDKGYSVDQLPESLREPLNNVLDNLRDSSKRKQIVQELIAAKHVKDQPARTDSDRTPFLTTDQKEMVIAYLISVEDESANEIYEYFQNRYNVNRLPDHLKSKVINVINQLQLISDKDYATHESVESGADRSYRTGKHETSNQKSKKRTKPFPMPSTSAYTHHNVPVETGTHKSRDLTMKQKGLIIHYLILCNDESVREIHEHFKKGCTVKMLPRDLRKIVVNVAKQLPLIYGEDYEKRFSDKSALRKKEAKEKTQSDQRPSTSSHIEQSEPVTSQKTPDLTKEQKALVIGYLMRSNDESVREIHEHFKKGCTVKMLPRDLRKKVINVAKQLPLIYGEDYEKRLSDKSALRKKEAKEKTQSDQRPSTSSHIEQSEPVTSQKTPDLTKEQKALVIDYLMRSNDKSVREIYKHFKKGYTVKMLPRDLTKKVINLAKQLPLIYGEDYEKRLSALRKKEANEKTQLVQRPSISSHIEQSVPVTIDSHKTPDLTDEQMELVIAYLVGSNDDSAPEIYAHFEKQYTVQMLPEHLRKKVENVAKTLQFIYDSDHVPTVTTRPHLQEPETVVPEIVVPETVVPETVVLETVEPETIVPETVVLETVEPETVVPETVVLETVEPETIVPETVVLETVVPEILLPETVVLETVVPETPLPETAVPETIVTETVIPEQVVPISEPQRSPSASPHLSQISPVLQPLQQQGARQPFKSRLPVLVPRSDRQELPPLQQNTVHTSKSKLPVLVRQPREPDPPPQQQKPRRPAKPGQSVRSSQQQKPRPPAKPGQSVRASQQKKPQPPQQQKPRPSAKPGQSVRASQQQKPQPPQQQKPRPPQQQKPRPPQQQKPRPPQQQKPRPPQQQKPRPPQQQKPRPPQQQQPQPPQQQQLQPSQQQQPQPPQQQQPQPPQQQQPQPYQQQQPQSPQQQQPQPPQQQQDLLPPVAKSSVHIIQRVRFSKKE